MSRATRQRRSRTILLSWLLLCAASVLFYGSDQPRGIAGLRQLQAPARRSAARWAGGWLVASAVGVELIDGTSAPVMVLSVSLAFMVALIVVTLGFSIQSLSTTKPLSLRPSAMAASTTSSTSLRRENAWRVRAAKTARALAAIVGSLKDDHTLILNGQACADFQSNPLSVLHADFPCGVFVPS